MNASALPQILCVDDEARVIEGLQLILRKEYQVHTATSGADALRILQQVPGLAVIVSDMRMPGIDGATLLHKTLRVNPDVTRILLTGQAGRDAAVAAVNKGQIFRFLTKPCPPEQFKEAIAAGVAQYRLATAERSMLQDTVLGCIEALVEVLAIANPLAFGRANRLKRRAIEFAAVLEMHHYWQLEAAAMLSQIGYVSLPAEIVQKLHGGASLNAEETALAALAPDFAIKLLDHIPRLEPVMQILTALNASDEQLARLGNGTTGLGARILGLCLEFDILIVQGQPVEATLQPLRQRDSRYGADLVEKFIAYIGAGVANGDQRDIPLCSVQTGMIILQDIRSTNGTLIVTKGFEVTNTFVRRISAFSPELLAETVRVLMPAATPPP
jgi:response regulator RpfG family c-di-GMP phosphodiesterase